MSSERATNYHPVKFLDKLEGNKHIVMFYDDEQYGDLIIARYFLNGLERDESCVFFTDEDPAAVEGKLRAQGIEVDKYKRSNSLRIFQTAPLSNGNLSVLDVLKGIRNNSTKGMKGPFRFAGRTILDIESIDGMLQGMEVEKTGQEHFAEFDNAQMCFYDVRKLEQSKREQWIKGLLKNHDQVIYASAPGKAVAFETTLLEGEEE
jgi:hypothetical protein